MKKTLIITLEYLPQIGGIASYVYNLASHLPPDKIVVYAPEMSGVNNYGESPWKVYRQKPYWFLWPHWLRMYWQIKNIVEKEKIETIQVHQALPVGYVALLIKKFQKISYTLFLHGTDLELGARKLNKLTKVCVGAEKIMVNSFFMKNKLLGKIKHLKNVDVMYPCPADNFFEAVSPEEINKLKSQLGLQGKKVILTVARMEAGKGYTQMVRLMSAIVVQVPNTVWLVIGDGSKKKDILESVQKYGLQNVVRFVGMVPQMLLPKYYQVADLFVLLTHKDKFSEEGWGMVFVEAAASGLPVVAGLVGGTKEAVEDGRTGLVVDTNDDNNVIAVIVSLLSDPEKAKMFGKAGQKRALENFTWNEQIKQHFDL